MNTLWPSMKVDMQFSQSCIYIAKDSDWAGPFPTTTQPTKKHQDHSQNLSDDTTIMITFNFHRATQYERINS